MSNPFDQFDAPAAEGGNPFDQFDAPAAKKLPSKGILSDVGGAFVEGAKSAGRAIAGTANIYAGDESALVEKAQAQESAQAQKPAALTAFNQAVTERVKPLGDDPGLLDSVKAIGGAVVDQPKGAGLAVVEQLPNAAPAIAGGMAGMKAGAALGTAIMPGVGTTIGAIGGGLAGMFLGNTAIETGYKGIEAAQDGAVTQDEMSRVKKEGAVKAGVITGVDALTLGLSKAVTNIPARAVESATRNALTKAGVNVADEAAVLAARQSPEISAAVRAAQESAFASANTLGKRAAAGGAALGLETVGEGLGEYLGELAATGKANVADAVLEAMMSLGQSGAEVAWGAARNKKAEQGGMWDTAEAKFQPPPPTLVTEPEPLQQRIDALMGIDTGAMSDKERTQYEKDLTAAFLEPVGVTQDEHGLEIPFTMADYLNAQVRAEDSVRARPLKQNAADQSGNRLQQLADEETQQQPDIPGYVAPEIPVVGTLSAMANMAIQSGAHKQSQMQQAMQAAVEKQKSTSEGSSRAAQPEQMAAQAPQANDAQAPAFDVSTRTEGQLSYLAQNGQPGWKEAATAEIQRRGVQISQAQQSNTDAIAPSAMVNPDAPAANSASVPALKASDSAKAPEIQNGDGVTNLPTEKRGIKTIDRWSAEELQGRLDRGNLSPESEQRLRAELAKRQPVKQSAPQASPLTVGKTPNGAEPVTVRNGVVHVGDYPAIDYETEADITVPEGATPQQIADALRKGGAIGSNKIFGLKAEESASQEKPAVEDPIGWTRMTKVEREALVARAGWAGKIRGMNLGGVRVATQAWDAMTEANRAKLIEANQNPIKNESPAAATGSAETGGQDQEPIKKDEQPKNASDRLRSGEINVEQFMEATGLTDDDVGTFSSNGARNKADAQAKKESRYHAGIEKISAAIFEAERGLTQGSTAQSRRAYQANVAKYRQAQETLGVIAKHYEHPFKNTLLSKLPPFLESRFGKQWDGIEYGDSAKRAFHGDSYRKWVDLLIGAADNKNGTPISPAVSQPKTDAAPEAKQDKAPAITPQHVENGESEPATAAVVEQSLMKGAANSPLDLRQERDLLLKKVDSAIAAAPTAEEKDAWNRVEQRIDLTNNMHVADTIGYRIFDVPGDGKFKVLNLKEALQRFRERVETNPGFRKPINEKPKLVADWQRTTAGGTEAMTKELLESGDYTAANEYAKQIGKPLVFAQYMDGSAIGVYTEAKPFEREGYDDFNMVSVRAFGANDKVAWAVVDLNSGLTVSSKHPSRMKAMIETNRALEKTTPANLATAVRSAMASNGAYPTGTQAELEQRWLANVEDREAQAQQKEEQEHRSKMRDAKGGMLAETSVGKDAAKKADDELAADIAAGVKNANDPERQSKVMADIEAKAAKQSPADLGGQSKKVNASDEINMGGKISPNAGASEQSTEVKEPWMMTLDEILPSDAEISDDGNTGFADSKLYDYGNPDMSKLSDIGGGYSVAPVKGRDSILLLLKGEYRIGVYTGEFGIKAAYRSKGLATKLVKEAMRRGIYTPDESYSVGGAKTVEKAHKEIIREAVSEGKPVPDEVLADYPDLKNATGDAKKQEEAKPVALLSIAGREKFDPISLDTAAGVVARMRQTIKEVWKVDLRLVPTFSALPQEVKDAIAKYGEGTRAKGVLHKGSVYIVADEHASDADVETTILHEIKGHVGLRRLYSDAINKDLGALYMSIGGRRGLADLAKARGFTDELQGYAESLSNSDFTDEERTRIVMEELLSHIAQDPKFGDKVKAIVGKIRAWLRDNGFMALAKFGEADLLNILAKASKALETVRDDNGPVVLMTAWHGSPHDHNKFDSSKIGTGEGAQAYGYGHYFAGAKDVAEWYRRKLSGADNSSITFNGKQYGDSDAANRKLTNDVKKWAEETGRDPERIDVALEYLAGMAGDLGSARQLAAKEGLGISHWIYGTLNDLSEHLYPSPNGRLYQVELAPTADEYLDWDKPLSEQSEFVRNALTDKSHFIGEYLSDTLEIAKNNGVDFNERGDTLYKIVSDQYGSDKAASDYLHSIGIRGIRYLDGSSRSAGEGNSNYVIFNDADVSITAKYNKASKDKLTPADTAIYGMAAEGKSAAEVLKFIASASRSPFNRQVAKLLMKTGIAPSVTVGDGKGWKMNAGEGNKYAAGYNPKSDTISLFRPASAERNMLHELMHAATLKALSGKGMAAAQMKALYQHVKKSGKLKGMYGMSDVDEFIAEAFSNPKFQAMLKQVSAAPVGGKPSSAWDWFVRVVRGILGLKQGADNALSQALEIGVEVMREDMALRKSEGGASAYTERMAKDNLDPDDAEAMRVQKAIEGKSTIDVAQWISVSGSPSERMIAGKVLSRLKMLESAGVNLKFKVAHVGDSIPRSLLGARGITTYKFGKADPSVDVWINGADVTGKVGTSVRTVLHELVHAATMGAVRLGGLKVAAGSKLAADVADLYAVTNSIIGHFNRRVADSKAGKITLTDFEQRMFNSENNAFRDVHETLAWALTDVDAQSYLESIPYQSKSAWTSFVSAIRQFLGLSSSADTALSEVLRVSEAIMSDNINDMIAMSNITGTAMATQESSDQMILSDHHGSDAIRYATGPKQTDSAAFRKWFGDSKVVDANGDPLVVYHGTGATDISEFKVSTSGTYGGGIYLTPEIRGANDYAIYRGAPSSTVYPVYAAIKNPASGSEAAQVASWKGEENAREELIRRGYDGVVDMRSGEIVAFYPEQIKSAIGNNGDFDPNNQDIRYNVADEGGDIGRIVGDSVSDQLKAAVLRLSGRPMLDHTDPFAAENARLREQDQSLWSKAKKQLRRYLAPGGLLPQSVFAEKIKRDSEFQAVEFDVRHLIGGLEQAVKADFGIAFDKLSKEQMRPITEALAGKVPASLPEATKTAAVAMRQYIDGMSTEYLKIIQQKIDAKMLKALESGKDSDKAQAINEIELFEKIKGNIGRYVHRSYQAFDDPKWFEKVPAHVLNASRLYLKQGYMEAGENDAKASQMAEVTLHEILKNGTAYDSMESFIAESKLGAKDLSVLMRRKEVPAQIRALLGEYPDARLNFTKSATKMGRLIWNTRFLDRVRDMGMGSFFFEGKDRPANATTQIAADGSEVYAPLNGLWTFPEIAQSFKDALGKEQMSDLYRAIVRFNGLVKYGKTVLAPTTAMRNWQSAMFFSLANGHFDLTQMKKSISAFREQVSQKATGQDLKYLRHLKQLGVVYDTPYAGEMARLMEDARMEELLSSDKGDAVRWFRKANQLAQGFYTFGDDFWKIIGFENEKAGLMKAGLSLQEAETEAAKRIRDTYPTYSMVGRGVQWLSRFPLAGTFVSFPAEIIRTSGNMLRTVAADLKSDNPKLRELGMKRAAGMVFVSAAFYSLAALSMAMAGVGDDEDEAIRDLAPEWQKNSTFLYLGRDEKGNLRYFDMSFLDPYGYWKRPITAMLRNQPWEDSLASGLRGMLEPFIGADIAAKAIFEAVANQKENGGKVYKEKDGAINQTIDVADHLRKALQPGVVGNVERLVKAAGDVRKSSGQPYSMEDELVALVGWRATTIDPKTALYYRSFEFTDAVAEARKTITETLRDANEITPEDIADAKARAQAKQEQAFKEMHRLVSAAESAGMSKMQIVQTLRLSNISQANIGSLMRGETPDVSITPQLAARAVRQASQMRGPEYAAEVFDRYRQARAN